MSRWGDGERGKGGPSRQIEDGKGRIIYQFWSVTVGGVRQLVPQPRLSYRINWSDGRSGGSSAQH